MATRSLIAYQDPNTQEYHSVYCHWDGYTSFNGQLLEKVYNNLELVKNLISKGNISTLLNQREDDGVLYAPLYYHAWRGDGWDDVKPNVASDLKTLFKLAAGTWAEYLYVFADGKWMYSDNLSDATSLKSLTDAVESVRAEDQFSAGVISQIKDAVNDFMACLQMPRLQIPRLRPPMPTAMTTESTVSALLLAISLATKLMYNGFLIRLIGLMIASKEDLMIASTEKKKIR